MEAMLNIEELIKWDKDHIIHPGYAIGQNLGVIMSKGHGVFIQDVEGKEYIDLASQLINVNLGHGRKEILDAISEQATKLQYATMFGGPSHEVAIKYSQKLTGVLEGLGLGYLTHFLFTSGGSESVDSAFMLARRFWHQLGKRKYKIISLHDSYHGSTMAAARASGLGKGTLQTGFEPFMPEFLKIPSYNCYRCAFGKEYPACDIQCAKFLGHTIENEGPENVAAFIAEPEIGSGGFLSPPDEWWPTIVKVCTDYDVLLIVDEVMTGFARTGKLFAIQHWEVKPDIMTMSKGITSGYIPFGAVAFSDRVFEGLKGVFCPGFTSSGNPIGCAAASAALDIYINEKVPENAHKVGEHTLKRLYADFGTLPFVDNISGLGLMLSFALVKDKGSKEMLDDPQLVNRIGSEAREKGLIIRVRRRTSGSGGDRICIAPPCIITAQQMDKALDILQPIIANIGK